MQPVLHFNNESERCTVFFLYCFLIEKNETNSSKDCLIALSYWFEKFLSLAAACDRLTYTVNFAKRNSDVQGYPLPLFEDQNKSNFDLLEC